MRSEEFYVNEKIPMTPAGIEQEESGYWNILYKSTLSLFFSLFARPPDSFAISNTRLCHHTQ